MQALREGASIPVMQRNARCTELRHVKTWLITRIRLLGIMVMTKFESRKSWQMSRLSPNSLSLSVPLIVGHQNWNIWAAHPLQTTSTGRKFWSHRSHGPLTETAYCIWHMIHVYSCDVHKTQIMIDLAVFKPYLKWNYKWNAVRLQKSCWSENFLCICAFSDFWTIFEKPR